MASAWLLQGRGHAVTVVDPAGPDSQPEGAGSSAALGVLMGQVYRRSSGRGWRLRQRSLQLWEHWRRELAVAGEPIPYRAGLLLLAADGEERLGLERLAAARQRLGIHLELWERSNLNALHPAVPDRAEAGLLSPRDGQLDPLAALTALRRDGLRRGLTLLRDRVIQLERLAAGWRVGLAGGGALTTAWVVVAAGLASPALLRPLGHSRELEPVLGQALELQGPLEPEPNWPGSLVWRGWNLVPRPGGRLWLGASLEPGSQADPREFEALRQLGGEAPPWLQEAAVELHRWQGLRARPIGRPAPLLELLEPGLLLATGHYRNGVLLAPASAEWVAGQIEAGATTGP